MDLIAPRRVLLVGHSCSPLAGSEPGLTWNWAVHLAAHHDVTLLCHPQYRSDVESARLPDGLRSLKIHWLELPRWLDPWRPERGEAGLKLHYFLWLRHAVEYAQRLHRQQEFDLVHQVSLGTVSAPSPFWRLKIPCFWGPVGGGQMAPSIYKQYFGPAWPNERKRNLRLRLLPWLPGYRSAMRRMTMAFGTNRETIDLMRRAGAPDARFFLDNGVSAYWLSAARPQRQPSPILTLVWCGRLEPHKGLPIALEAMAKVRDCGVRLLVAGDGYMAPEWKQLAGRLQLNDRVQFLGRLDQAELKRQFLAADAFLFTSLRESFGSVNLEAMGSGLPVIALAHQGIGTYLREGMGIKVPVLQPGQTVAELAFAIREFAALSADARARMGEAAWRYVQDELWQRRALRMTACYEEVLRSASGFNRGEVAA
jgi:glycosyltransferase involved in cell wall biosynthesis